MFLNVTYNTAGTAHFPDVAGEVELLIGADTLANYPFSDSIVGPKDTPGAILTCLGWCLFGKDPSMNLNCDALNFIATSMPMSLNVDELPMLSSDSAVNFIAATLPLTLDDCACPVSADCLGVLFRLPHAHDDRSLIADKSKSRDIAEAIGDLHVYFSCSSLNETLQEESERISPLCRLCGNHFADMNEDPIATRPSLDDERATRIMNETLQRVDGRIQIGLPWRYDDIKLPYNYNMAMKRLMSVKRRCEKDPEYFASYAAKMDEYLSNGYAERVPDEDLQPTIRTWFLPHHATRQSKFRIVFDSSAEFGGTSLNKNLLSGPDNGNSLVGVIERFRLHPVAFSCDMKQMYHRVLVHPDDVQALNYLWYPSNDLTRLPAQYRMLSHVFGATSSPCAG